MMDILDMTEEEVKEFAKAEINAKVDGDLIHTEIEGTGFGQIVLLSALVRDIIKMSGVSKEFLIGAMVTILSQWENNVEGMPS